MRKYTKYIASENEITAPIALYLPAAEATAITKEIIIAISHGFTESRSARESSSHGDNPLSAMVLYCARTIGIYARDKASNIKSKDRKTNLIAILHHS